MHEFDPAPAEEDAENDAAQPQLDRFFAERLPFWIIVAAALIAGIFSFRSIRSGVFNSPDEMGNFLAARAFAESGRFSLDPYVDFGDPEGILHPRAFVVFEGRPTTIQFAMTPLIHAPGIFLTDEGNLSAGFWAVFGVLGLGMALRRICRDPWAAALGLLSGAPLIYWLMHQYNSASSFIVFAGWAAWAGFAAAETKNRWQIAGALVFATAALSARPDFLPIIGMWALAGVGLLWRREGRFGTQARLSLAMAVAVGALTVAGQLLFGLVVFGDPFTNGRALYLESVGAAFPVDLGTTNPLIIFRNLLFPAGAPSLEIAPKSVWKYYLATAPILSLLFAFGLALGYRRKELRWFYGACLVLVIYGVLSRLSNETRTAATWSPSFASATARYFIPTYLIVLLAIAPGALRLLSARLGPHRLAGLTAIAGLVTVSAIGFQFESAHGKEGAAIRAQERLGQLVLQDTSGEGVVFTYISDKPIAPFVNTAAGVIEFTDIPPDLIVASVRRLLEFGVPAYFFIESPEMSDALTSAGFTAVPTAPNSLLKRIVRAPRPFSDEVSADNPLMLLEGGGANLPQAASDAVHPDGPSTYEFWLKFDQDVVTIQGLLGKVRGDKQYFAPTADRSFEAAIGENEFRFSLSDGAKVAGLRIGPVVPLADGKWHHLVITWDGRAARDALRVYIDGVFQVAGASELTTLQRVTGLVNVGGAGTTKPWLGQIGLVAVYDQALSFDRILAHYASGKKAFEAR